MSRSLTIGTRRFTEVLANDKPGPGGANHEYLVVSHSEGDEGSQIFTTVKFQKGPVKETGINGIHNEDLIAIVVDRLRGFQSGEFACRENALALTKLEETLHWLNHRTNERIGRGVEGTNQI